MVKKIITDGIRRFIVGRHQIFTFLRVNVDNFSIPSLLKTDLYIHIPFCKSMCPYCPYNKVKYDKNLVNGYIEALLEEINIYSNKLGKIEVSSVYIGGGTPTNLINELGSVLYAVRNKFNVTGDIAIETTISDINEYNLNKLKTYGINMISVGIQSFDYKYLKLLGRNYNSSEIGPALKLLKAFNFENINTDLIFAFPGQTTKEALTDIQRAINHDIDQITIYPLFTFPYSTVGEYLRIKRIIMPNIFKRRKLYKMIYNYFLQQEYKVASVWSFKKSINTKKYSSVTREEYIGLGAGAGSRFDNLFYFNTFSINDYQNRLSSNQLPVAISMPISKKLINYYWFYWKLYNGKYDLRQFSNHKDWKMKIIQKLFLAIGFSKKNGRFVHLTERGAFWIHLAQNYFLLDYINIVWSRMKKEAFPDKINI